VRPERHLLGPPRGRSAHGAAGALVLPGGAVGLLPCVVVAVGAAVGDLVRPGWVLVTVVGAVVGTAVTGGDVTDGLPVGTVAGPEVGVLVGAAGVVVARGVRLSPVVGRGVSSAISAGGAVGRCSGFAASGRGISGVSIRGPPSKLLTMSRR
jgi:hypothetical protein